MKLGHLPWKNQPNALSLSQNASSSQSIVFSNELIPRNIPKLKTKEVLCFQNRALTQLLKPFWIWTIKFETMFQQWTPTQHQMPVWWFMSCVFIFPPIISLALALWWLHLSFEFDSLSYKNQAKRIRINIELFSWTRSAHYLFIIRFSVFFYHNVDLKWHAIKTMSSAVRSCWQNKQCASWNSAQSQDYKWKKVCALWEVARSIKAAQITRPDFVRLRINSHSCYLVGMRACVRACICVYIYCL